MGMFTDVDYIPNTTQSGNVDYSLRNTGTSVSDYFDYTNTTITAETESRLEDVRSYDNSNPYRLNFQTNTGAYINYSGNTIQGIDTVTSLGNPLSYVFDMDKNDPNSGTTNQKSGLLFQNYTGDTNNTIVSFVGEGWNETNISLSAITKEEYLFGIVSKPEVKNDLFIDRGITIIFEKHLKLSEITNLDELTRYGKGYYKLIKQ